MEIFKKGISCLLDKDAVGLNEVVNGWHEVCCQIWVFPGVSRRDVPFQVCIFPGFRLSLHATKPTRGIFVWVKLMHNHTNTRILVPYNLTAKFLVTNYS